MQDLKADLEALLDEAEWVWLLPHAQQDRVLVVARELDLLEVGVAIASDNITSVQRWIAEALVCKPSAQQLSDWGQNDQQRFPALIVRPYILIHEPILAEES